MKFHPYSEIFPLIEGAEFDALVTDIKAHGLREKIWLYEGKVLDGRNRYLACQKAKVRPAYRKFTGRENDALSFVVSANITRRHLTEQQRALAAARVATLEKGGDTNAPRGALTQTEAAEVFNVGRRSVQRARQVIDQGSKALQRAVESGEVPLTKAAAVVDLPKSEQLKAATQKPAAPDAPERPEDDADEDAALEAAERELNASIDKVMRADDRTAAMHDEIKRQAAEIAVLKIARDGFMNGKTAITKLLKAEQRKTERFERENKKLREELEALRERIAIMEAS